MGVKGDRGRFRAGAFVAASYGGESRWEGRLKKGAETILAHERSPQTQTKQANAMQGLNKQRSAAHRQAPKHTKVSKQRQANRPASARSKHAHLRTTTLMRFAGWAGGNQIRMKDIMLTQGTSCQHLQLEPIWNACASHLSYIVPMNYCVLHASQYKKHDSARR